MNAAKRYQQTAQTTASPARLLVLLLHAAVKNMRLAREELESGELASGVSYLNKANDIVLYLQGTLDHGVAPELSGNLDAVYAFVSLRLSSALLRRSTEEIGEAERVLLPVVDAFDTVVSQSPEAP